ncbi:lipid kinase YegS [Xanthomonas maliensis]|uniref:lipid kinase YegS n=1 Tax=Xanthomonas maliensis TaxID=1321368 RepID=UPI0003A55C8B|nr:lipid kinase YegS [Xanthomonas maliensis]KAB7768576.1 lipid kinase YegS [Xanthomonas maliensis]
MVLAHWRLILNGKSTDNEDLREAVATLRARGVRIDVRVTWEAGDAERYVAEALADGVQTVVAAGGDGTLSEVAAALAHQPDAADVLPSLGLLPLGTANDFATAAAVPVAPLEALQLILERPAQPVDLLRIDTAHGAHWCANVASGGFGTQVTVETDEGLKKMLGGLAYLITGMSRLGRIDPIRARFSGPDFDWDGDFIALGLGNGRQAGGGQALCPEALIDDGLLDLTIVPALTGEVAATLGTLVTGGKQAALERVAIRRRLPWLEIASEQSLTLNLDGEPEAAQRFRIDCVPARLRMHLPLGCPLCQAVG